MGTEREDVGRRLRESDEGLQGEGDQPPEGFLAEMGLAIPMKAPPSVLWHYTTLTGLVGILGERKLRATEFRFMNDAQEFYCAVDVAKKVVEDMLRVDPRGEAFLNAFLYACEHPFDRSLVAAGATSYVYVFSLSELPDDLSQWRAYSGLTTGFAVGFETRRLQQIAPQLRPYFGKCEYEETEQKSMVRPVLEKHIQKWLVVERPNPMQLRSAATQFFMDFMRIAPMIKHWTFKEEKEWRLVLAGTPPDPHARLRPGERIPIPYRELGFRDANYDTWPIREIKIGPTYDKDLIETSVTVALQPFAQPESQLTTISFSEVPYRNWL